MDVLQQFTISHQGNVYAVISNRRKQVEADPSKLIIASIVTFTREGNDAPPVTFGFDHTMLAGLKAFIDAYFKAHD